MPTIVHFEIPADNLQRARTFYGDLLGWKIEKYEDPNNPSSMEYWLITTTDEKGEKALMGGMMQREQPQQQILNYIDVPSIDEYASKVEKLGGMSLETFFENLKAKIEFLGELEKFEREAVVSDKSWVETLVKISDKLFPSVDVKHFSFDEKNDALAWIKN